MQLVKSVVHQARRSPRDPAIAFGGGVASYAQLMGATSAFAEALRLLGVKAGQLVVLDVRNPIHHTAGIYALALMGVRSASVGTASVTQYGGPRPDLFLTDRDDLPLSDLPMRRIDQRWFLHEANAPVDYARLLAMPGFPNSGDVVRYVYSSGTTGRPKCVGLTNASLALRFAHTFSYIHQRTIGGSSLNMMGFSTIAGYMSPLLRHSLGGLLCFSSNYEEALNLARLFHVSVLAGSVGQLQGILKVLGADAPPPGLECVAVYGSKLPRAMLLELQARLSPFVTGAYGATEIGGLTAATADDFTRHEGAAGYILPWAEIEAVDDNGRRLPPGQDGILRARSDEQAFYVDEAGSRVDITQGGWFYPGDYGRIEADGLVVITGRIGDVINRGGVIVAPELIEDVFRNDPRIVDVAIVGATTAAGIDEIWAAFVAEQHLEPVELIAAARQKLNERVPDRMIQIPEIPRNDNRKVMRNALRDQLRSLFEG